LHADGQIFYQGVSMMLSHFSFQVDEVAFEWIKAIAGTARNSQVSESLDINAFNKHIKHH
jgi:hypothetical protein